MPMLNSFDLHALNAYNPDVLTCLANLSSDEVFTPPQLANQMLDLLPAELWSDPNARFLDPACKSGVFLREIARRLDAGLEQVIPDRQQRMNHIFHESAFRHRDHRSDRAFVAPQCVLLEGRQQQVFRVRDVQGRAGQYPLRAYRAYMAQQPLRVLRREPTGICARRRA